MSEIARYIIEENIRSKRPYLDLGRCGLTEIPDYIEELTWIETLVLSNEWLEYNPHTQHFDYKKSVNSGKNNNILSLSPALSSLKSLKRLFLQNQSSITDLNPIKNLIELTELNLIETQVNDLSQLSNLTNLRILILVKTQIEDISPISNLHKLQVINFSMTRVNNLTPLTGLINLERLICFDTNISDLSPLSQLTELKEFACSSSLLEDLTPLKELAQLQFLSCPYTQVSDISPLISLSKLRIIILNSTNIEDITPLSNLTNLNAINLSSTKINNFSALINLSNLQEIYCSNTPIRELAPLKTLPNLSKLDCSNTQIKKSEPLIEFKSLTEFKLLGCAINDCSTDVFESGDPELLRAYFKLKKSLPRNRRGKALNSNPSKDVKLILLGNSDSGKTSLLHYLKTNKFLVDRNSTHGLMVHRWNPDIKRFPDLKDIAISIWDFGGQEYYHGAYRLFMSSNTVYLLVWDGETNFNGKKPTVLKKGDEKVELEHFELKYWLDTIRHYGGEHDNSPLLVVQNKTDISGKKRLDINMHDEYNIIESFHISLLEARKNKKKLENNLLDQLCIELEQNLLSQSDDSSLPHEWLSIRDAILELQNDINTQEINNKNPFHKNLSEDGSLSLSEFEEAAQQLLSSSTYDSIKHLPKLFERGGIVAFFEDSQALKDKVFINPSQLVDRLYYILNKEVLSLGGEFNPNQVFDADNLAFKTTFIEVASKLELIFPHPVNGKDGWYIAPQYLPETHPIEDIFIISDQSTWQNDFWLKVPLFYYKKLLHGLLLHYASDNQSVARHFWKNGIIFIKNNLFVIIKGQYPKKYEHEGILFIGVQKEINNEHINLQREIFNKCQYLLVTKDDQSQRSSGRFFANSLEQLENPSFTNNGFTPPKWLEVSKDGLFFVPYLDLLDAFGKEDVYINTKDNKGYKERILVRSLEALLPPKSYTTKKVFISYSHHNIIWLSRLQTHLGILKRSNKIETWTDLEIIPGEEWEKSIHDAIENADVFILLLSVDFISSNYIWEIELKRIFETYKNKNKRVIPIMIEPMDMFGLPGVNIIEENNLSSIHIQDFQIIPNQNGLLKPISLWTNPEEALALVAKEIRKIINN